VLDDMRDADEQSAHKADQDQLRAQLHAVDEWEVRYFALHVLVSRHASGTSTRMRRAAHSS
jgi:hypothetical protein